MTKEKSSRAVGATFEFLLTSIGPERAAKSLQEYLTYQVSVTEPVSLVISTGFAGAFIEGSKAGDFFIADSVALDDAPVVFQQPVPTILDAFGDARRAPFRTTSRLVNLSQPKGSLDGVAGKVIEMESAALAQVCARASIPFVSFRCISDTPSTPLPGFVNSWADVLQQPGVVAGAKAVTHTVGFMAKNPVIFSQFLKHGMDLKKTLETRWKEVAERLVAFASTIKPSMGL